MGKNFDKYCTSDFGKNFVKFFLHVNLRGQLCDYQTVFLKTFEFFPRV